MWWLLSLTALVWAGDRGRCHQAMTHDTIRAWAAYAERFPDGRCVELAYARMDDLREDASACHKARVDNTLEAWADYARRYPTGSCGVEAASELLARRQRGEVPDKAVAPDNEGHPTVRLKVSPDLGEGWDADIPALARALASCALDDDLVVVMGVGPTGPGAARLETAKSTDSELCALAAFRQHPWPRPADDAVLTATVSP